MRKGEALEAGGIDAVLGEDELELVAMDERQTRVGLGTDANPVEPVGRRASAVGLNRDGETLGMEGIDESAIELQQRLAPGADDEAPCAGRGGPSAAHRRRKLL